MDVAEIKELMDKIDALSEKNDFKAVIIISDDPEKAPDFLKERKMCIRDRRIADDTNPSTWNKTEQSVTA